jgi:hypothetical protein
MRNLKYAAWTKAKVVGVKAGGTHSYHSTTNDYATMPPHRTILETKFSVLCSNGTRVIPLKRDNIVHLICPLVGLALYCVEQGGQLTSTTRANYYSRTFPFTWVCCSPHKLANKAEEHLSALQNATTLQKSK